MEYIANKILYKLLAYRLGVCTPGSARLETLELGGYAKLAFELLGIETVEDALLAYCLRHDTPGIGKASWDAFFNCVTR